MDVKLNIAGALGGVTSVLVKSTNTGRERSQFMAFDEVDKVNAKLFDHTKKDTTHNAMRLTGLSNNRIGLARSFSVMPGDEIQMEVYAKYVDPDKKNHPDALAQLLATIALPASSAYSNVLLKYNKMEKAEIIKDNFQKAAKGIDNDLVKDKDKWYNLVLNMPKHLQVVYTIIIFQHEVFNGGFHQYFFNASGQFAYLTMENLKLIKAFKTFEILEKALKEVNSGGYNLDEFRNKIFYRKLEGITQFDENLFNFLNDLDSEYYELEGKEDIEQLLIGYLKSHQG